MGTHHRNAPAEPVTISILAKCRLIEWIAPPIRSIADYREADFVYLAWCTARINSATFHPSAALAEVDSSAHEVHGGLLLSKPVMWKLRFGANMHSGRGRVRQSTRFFHSHE